MDISVVTCGLRFDIGLGYAFYAEHSENDTNGLLLTPGSQLSFDVRGHLRTKDEVGLRVYFRDVDVVAVFEARGRAQAKAHRPEKSVIRDSIKRLAACLSTRLHRRARAERRPEQTRRSLQKKIRRRADPILRAAKAGQPAGLLLMRVWAQLAEVIQ